MIKLIRRYSYSGLALAFAGASQNASAAQDLRQVDVIPGAIESRTIPAVNLEKAVADRMDFMAGQIATLEHQATKDKTSIEALRAEIEELKRLNGSPKGYQRAFITKFNWDHLDPDDGIEYYARIKRF